MKLYEWCKQFRTDTLKLTLNEMSNLTGTKLKTISAFENGRSTNIQHLNMYIDCCIDSTQEELFLIGVLKCMRGVK